jgi:hypothetical protein
MIISVNSIKHFICGIDGVFFEVGTKFLNILEGHCVP